MNQNQTERDEAADLRAEVEHWKHHAWEAGEGFKRAIEDGNRARARSRADRDRAEKAEAERGALQRQVDARLTVDEACEVMHDAYERAAVGAGWETNPASRKPWSDVPEANKETMRAAVGALLAALDAVEPADQPHPTPEAGCGHPNHGAPDHDCTPFAPEAPDLLADQPHPTPEAHEGEASQGFLEIDAHWKCSCGARGVAESLVAARDALAAHATARQQDEEAQG